MRFALPVAASVLIAAVSFAAGAYFGSPMFMDRQAVLNEIAGYHAIYAREKEHLVEVGAERRDHIEFWLGNRLNRKLRVPDLSASGWTFAGGRLLVFGGKPVAQFMYTQPGHLPLAVCVTFGPEPEASRTVEALRGLRLANWQGGGYTYVVVGDEAEPVLHELSERVEQGLWQG